MKTSALRLIRNNRVVMRLAPKREQRWPNNLPPPVLGADNRNKSLAVSALRCFVMKDGEPVHACDITPDQARDIANWSNQCIST